jgi:uncharacterized protein YlxW (UPF0749 family)
MEKQQLELLIKENSELKEQLELLKEEILILKNKSSNKSEIRDLLDENFETSQQIGLSLEISIVGIEDDGVHLSVDSSLSEIGYHGYFEISFVEINEWFIENDKIISSDNLNECLEELVSNVIDNLF